MSEAILQPPTHDGKAKRTNVCTGRLQTSNYDRAEYTLRIIGVAAAMVRFIFFTAVFVSCSMLLMISKSSSTSFEDFHALLPGKIMGWSAESKDRFFDEKTIFDYIDGAGEVYRAYNMRWCLSRRYIIPNGPAMVLDIFDMGASEDAFGVFTHDRDGKVLDVGQDALYRPGWLSFWKDRFFVSIFMEAETPDTEKAVNDLGMAVASHITGKGAKPRIVSQLPPDGLQARSVRYLHHPVVLNYHFYLSDENILDIGPRTGVVLATYRRGKDGAWLLLVWYPDAEKGVLALKSFLKHYLPDADAKGVALLENGKWTAVSLKDKILSVVLEADSRQLAESLLKEVRKN